MVLLGGALLALPILIHLIMRRKPKPLIFPALRFLQQRRQVNLQRMRLRHLLLLALRLLLIGLMCLALARPILSGAPADWAGASKMAVVFVFDSSVSMAYVHEGRSRLRLAKELAEGLLQQLSKESLVAVLDSSERGSNFVSVADGLQLIKTREIREVNRPITAAIDQGVRLMEQVPADLPLLLCIFSDRTAASWDADYAATTLRPNKLAVEKKIGRPVRCVYLDLGLAEPRTVAVVGLAVRLQNDVVVPIEQLRLGGLNPGRVRLQATVRATSTTVNNALRLLMDGKERGEKSLQLTAPPGRAATTLVTFDEVEISGLHVGEVRLKNGDPKDKDDTRDYWNLRHFTLSCQERQVLLLADDPADAIDFQLALESLQTLAVKCTVRRTTEVPALLTPDAFAAVALINVARPSDDLWRRLTGYVNAGGGLMILPGANAVPTAYQTDAALALTPARLKEVRNTPKEGAFLDPINYDHPIMARIRNWDRDLTPGRIFRFWDVEPIAPPQSTVITPYSFEKRPALIERLFDQQQTAGRVVMFTSALYRRPTPDWVEWNNFLDEQGFWLSIALPYLMTNYVMGGRAEQANFIVGEPIRFWLPAGKKVLEYRLSGPISGQVRLKGDAKTVLLPEARRCGSYEVRDAAAPAKPEPRPTAATAAAQPEPAPVWVRHFSVNLSPEEIQWTEGRPTPEALNEVLGSDALQTFTAKLDLKKLAHQQTGTAPPVELLPLLLLGVLLLLALENWLANRFYKPIREATA
jgi:hypothetical protein